ncbi:MAG: ATP-binding cassette domain-containing protein [Firmicutes bacterium]|jgi:ABC-2 type transport system ATP-binding protein|nr:ATP-binding cassette domain-containing protein [Bacillota bacterium]
MALSVLNVTKRFRDITAVKDLSFKVDRGRILGFLGPNGAGKTTTMRVILGILKPDAGHVSWEGRPLSYWGPALFGYLPEERGLYPKMHMHEHLVFLGQLNGLSSRDAKVRADQWIERLGLGEYRGKRIEELSKGNQQKVQVIGALLHQPKLLILDEPFSGLDPVNTAMLKEVLLEQSQTGCTVVFSSHRMDQVEELCEDIVLIHRGELVLSGNLQRIKSAMGRQILRVALEGRRDFWRRIPGLTLLADRPDYLEFRIDPSLDPNIVLTQALQAGKVIRFELMEPSLDQIFVERVGAGA